MLRGKLPRMMLPRGSPPKPDDFLGGIKKMFGMEDEEPAAPAPAEEEPAPADEPAPEESEE